MKSFILALICLLTVSASAQAQSAIDVALAPLPARAREGATVIKWNADHTYESIKEGASQLVCYDRSSERDRRPVRRAVHEHGEPRQSCAKTGFSGRGRPTAPRSVR